MTNVQGISKRLFPRCVKLDELFTYCKQENANFSSHIPTTWEEPFRDSLYHADVIRQLPNVIHDWEPGAKRAQMHREEQCCSEPMDFMGMMGVR